MCRADVSEAATAPLAALLVDMGRALAAQIGADVDDVRIGPVDLGGEPC